MNAPRLTFYCELANAPLQALFAQEDVIPALRGLEASVSLGLLDLSPERAAVVKRLNQAGIPLVAWLLLPPEQGYWFNVDNAAEAAARYQAFRDWTAEHGLRWARVGLDIEPDIRQLRQLAGRPWRLALTLLGRALDDGRLRAAQTRYRALVAQIRADGYAVDSYHFPFILDERQARSTVLQRWAGLVDFPADREVLMLYSSFLRPHGPGVLWNYAMGAQSVGLGNTGGGVDTSGLIEQQYLNWDEFVRDLRLAACQCDDLHIFSLEGCVAQGFLERLQDFDWDGPVRLPLADARRVGRWRRAARLGLWAASRPWLFLLLALGLAGAWAYLRRIKR